MKMRRSLQLGSPPPSAANRTDGQKRELPVQAGALPWRCNVKGRMEVLLITSRSSGRWIIPKGQPMADKTLAQAAAIEAFEEAGVEGEISHEALGEFEHEKRHWLTGPVRYRIVVHALAVHRELATWPEQTERKRIWLAPEEAASIVRSEQLAALLRRLRAKERRLTRSR